MDNPVMTQDCEMWEKKVYTKDGGLVSEVIGDQEIWEACIDGYACGAIKSSREALWSLYTGCIAHFMKGENNYSVNFNVTRNSVPIDRFTSESRAMIAECVSKAQDCFPEAIVNDEEFPFCDIEEL